jgi:chitinase
MPSEWTFPNGPGVDPTMPTRAPVTNFPTASPASTTNPSLLPGMSAPPTDIPAGTPGLKLVADAGPPTTTGTVAVSKVLTAGATSTPIGGTVKYLWSFTSAPPTSTAVLSTPTAASAAFTPNVSGTYVVKLTVYDTWNNKTDSITVTVP